MNLVRGFNQSAGVLLLALGLGLFLSLGASVELAPPRDSLLLLSVSSLHGVAGAIALVLAGVCLFKERTSLAVAGVLWLASNFWVYVLGLRWTGAENLNGVLWTAPDTFGLSAEAAGIVAEAAFGYLWGGSVAVLLVLQWQRRHAVAPAPEFKKISCPHCGGHVAFPWSRAGQSVACPHCGQQIVLHPP
jgi:ribosomal protein S27E